MACIVLHAWLRTQAQHMFKTTLLGGHLARAETGRPTAPSRPSKPPAAASAASAAAAQPPPKIVSSATRWCKKCSAVFPGQTCAKNHANFWYTKQIPVNAGKARAGAPAQPGAQPEPKSAAKPGARKAPVWNVVDWMQSRAVSQRLVTALKPTSTKRTHIANMSRADWVAHVRGCIDEAAGVLYEAAQTLLSSTVATTACELNSKFAEKGTFEYGFGDRSDFDKGLDGRVGSPSDSAFEEMKREHTHSSYSNTSFTSPNFGITTSAKQEYQLVVKRFTCFAKDFPEWSRDEKNMPRETKLAPGAVSRREAWQPLIYYMKKAKRDYKHVVFSVPELIAARTYTGCVCPRLPCHCPATAEREDSHFHFLFPL